MLLWESIEGNEALNWFFGLSLGNILILNHLWIKIDVPQYALRISKILDKEGMTDMKMMMLVYKDYFVEIFNQIGLNMGEIFLCLLGYPFHYFLLTGDQFDAY